MSWRRVPHGLRGVGTSARSPARPRTDTMTGFGYRMIIRILDRCSFYGSVVFFRESEVIPRGLDVWWGGVAELRFLNYFAFFHNAGCY